MLLEEVHEERRAWLIGVVHKGLSLQEIGNCGGVTREYVRQLLHRYHLHAAWQTARKRRTDAEKTERRAARRAEKKGALLSRYVAKIFSDAGYRVEEDEQVMNRLVINRVPVEIHVCHKPAMGGQYYRVNSSHARSPRVAVLPTGACYVLPPRIDRPDGLATMSYIPARAAREGHVLRDPEHWATWRRWA